MKKPELKKVAIEMFNDGKSKDELSMFLMTNGIAFSKVPATLKEFEISFGRSKNEKPLPLMLADLMADRPGLSKEEYIEKMAEFTTNPKYLVNHYGPIIEYAQSLK